MGHLREAARRPTNLSKITEVITEIMQEKDGSPRNHLQRLLEAYQIYMQIDPEVPEQQYEINMMFVSQDAPDIS